MWNFITNPYAYSNIKSHPTLSQNLISYYKADVSGSFPDSAWSNNGTINWATFVANGKINWAYDYDWVNDFVSLSWGISWWTARTHSFWIKKDASTWWTAIYSSGDTGTPLIFSTIYTTVNSNNDVYWAFSNSDFHTPIDVITDGVYAHVVCVYDWWILSTSTVHIYVNAVSQSLTKSGLSVWEANTTDANYTIWKDFSTAWREFNWEIDEIWMWDKALTQSEVTDLYNNGSWYLYNF